MAWPPRAGGTPKRGGPDGALFRDQEEQGGEYVAYFKYNSETIFWTEGYKSKASAVNAIESIKKNGPGSDTREAE